MHIPVCSQLDLLLKLSGLHTLVQWSLGCLAGAWCFVGDRMCQQRRGNAGAAADGVVAALALAAEFPPAQRLYVLFLEAADSHRLNRQLLRCVLLMLFI